MKKSPSYPLALNNQLLSALEPASRKRVVAALQPVRAPSGHGHGFPNPQVAAQRNRRCVSNGC
jgi:hypothetical protein